MSDVSKELKQLISGYYVQLEKMDESEMDFKPGPARWSKKEILGHLIDSAQNNIRRFIVAQYEEQPEIVYQQDEWVRLNSYRNMESRTLIELWFLLNQQICHLLGHMNDAQFEKTCFTGTVRTVDWLATDYIKHLRHHIHQILNLEAVEYP